ncbi:hypothetical protein KP79_PYT16799 [Mizuhopecten yessoensis]|uniref:SGNH hydrolase-type esterase domain-containing protein n=1 Tax=Mizuhopecten yessoensis TaxID=6573 RepID=A0A210PGC1_MIZYE|nr:hypothetical protein KP79_PYT16799 [Mizuhopecten yessoensis]
MATVKVAIFGDAYVARLRDYCDGDFHTNSFTKVLFFGYGGLKCSKIPQQIIAKALNFKPDTVFLHLCGNDITADSTARDVFDSLAMLIDELYRNGVKRFCVGDILTRGSFTKCPGLDKESFDRQRTKINKLLRKNYSDIYSFPHKYPEDYSTKDKVHIATKGNSMRKYFLLVYELQFSK